MWVPLLSIGVAYVGFLLAVLLIAVVNPGQYEHIWDLQFGLIALGWSVLALASIVASIGSLFVTRRHVRRWIGGVVIALNVAATLALAYILPWSIGSIDTYSRGLAAYQQEIQRCGQRPVLASKGWGGDVLLPNDADYERLKYAPSDHFLLVDEVYFCTLADAEAHGYPRQQWHDTVTCSAAGCPVATFFDKPLAYPPWKLNGTVVPASEIMAVAGPGHCGWASATFLTFGWPLGTRPQAAAGSRQYIRDKNHVVPRLLPLDLHATLPTDARSTGYTFGDGVALYLSPSDQDQFVYLVGSTVERWPRSDPMTVCS
ncbi:MAG: hypothetical protein M3Z28_12265 [Candidatus Dormibacteraeota bacterium]|nr:hypothetical protein [Candidatus Dormibacteraeota bacterium]